MIKIKKNLFFYIDGESTLKSKGGLTAKDVFDAAREGDGLALNIRKEVGMDVCMHVYVSVHISMYVYLKRFLIQLNVISIFRRQQCTWA